MEQELIALLRKFQYDAALDFISKNVAIDLNYIDSRTGRSLLMSAVVPTSPSKDQSRLAVFVSFLLNNPNFNQLMYCEPRTNRTAYDWSVASLKPEVLAIFHLHQAMHHNVFTHKGMLVFKEINDYLSSILNTYRTDVAELTKENLLQNIELIDGNIKNLRNIKSIIRDMTIRYAIEQDDVSIFVRMREAGDEPTWDLMDGTLPRTLAERMGKNNVFRWLNGDHEEKMDLLASQVRLFHLKEARSSAEAEYEENKVAIGTVFRGKVEGVLEQISLRK